MSDPIKLIEALDFRWMVENPFLFCAHHNDHFPKGEDNLGPAPESLAGREMGLPAKGCNMPKCFR